MNTTCKNYKPHHLIFGDLVVAQYMALNEALGHEPTPDEITELGGYIRKALEQELDAGNKKPTIKELIHSMGTVIDSDPRELTDEEIHETAIITAR